MGQRKYHVYCANDPYYHVSVIAESNEEALMKSISKIDSLFRIGMKTTKHDLLTVQTGISYTTYDVPYYLYYKRKIEHQQKVYERKE